MKTNLKYIFIVVVVIVIGAILYYFFGMSSDYTLNIKEKFAVDGGEVTFKAKASLLKLELNDPMMFDGKLGVAKELKSKIEIIVESDKEVTCTYDLVYVHDEDYIKYAKTESSNNEFTISYNENEVQIADFGKETIIGSFSETGPMEEAKDITLKFYNIEENQMSHINTIYAGNLKINNLECHS